tara:strand:+ start:37598 stop:37786 length:189 start_codon:yes stop_codon:yes gene_type:complete
MKCFWCDTVPAGYAVITGAVGDDKGDVTHATFKWACCDCAVKPLLELLAIARDKNKAAPPYN